MPIRVAIARLGIDSVLGEGETVAAVALGLRRALPTAEVRACPPERPCEGVDLVVAATEGGLPEALVTQSRRLGVPLALLAWEPGEPTGADLQMAIVQSPSSAAHAVANARLLVSQAAESMIRLLAVGARLGGGGTR